MKKGRHILWLQSASAFMDLSVIYCLSILLGAVCRKFTYIQAGDLFVATFGLYYLGCGYFLHGVSPSKQLTGLQVLGKGQVPMKTKQMLLREFALKLFAGILFPSYLLQLGFKIWSPFYTIIVQVFVLLLSLLWLLAFKKTWWEMISQTRTFRYHATPSRKNVVFLSYTLVHAFALMIMLQPVFQDRPHFSNIFYPRYPLTRETNQYTAFIKHSSKDPVDYLFDLFKRYDMVVLSERYHPEYTQYDLIKKIIGDQRFIDSVGNVFTETGSVSFQDTLDTYLNTVFTSDSERDRSTAVLQRKSNAIWPLWDLTNHFDLLEFVNRLNNTLPDTLRVNWFYADIPVDWEKMTRQNYRKGFTALRRDSVMALHILEKYKGKIAGKKRNKALVILNTNHGYALHHFGGAAAISWVDSSTTSYLMAALPGKVANVMLNTVTYMWTPVQHGKWETAFREAGNPNAGFDFSGSPFGDDTWDAFFLSNRLLTYKQIFTGFIFYQPLENHLKREGFPYELDHFQDSLLRRAACVDQSQIALAKNLISLYNRNPALLISTSPAPYALWLNGLNSVVIPLLVLLDYIVGMVYYARHR